MVKIFCQKPLKVMYVHLRNEKFFRVIPPDPVKRERGGKGEGEGGEEGKSGNEGCGEDKREGEGLIQVLIQLQNISRPLGLNTKF